jgi:hypothetical protein
MKRKDKFNYAMQILKENNIETTNKVLTINCFGNIVIHCKRLKNCIIIPPQATKRTILNTINRQLSII